MNFRQYKKNENYIKFYSNAKPPYHILSNFAQIKGGIKVNGLIYASSEHAFQAQRFIKKDRNRFTIHGDLGTINAFNVIFNQKESEKKKKYWMKKDNIGIVAKLATNEKRAKKLGLTWNDNFVSTDELWIKILSKKFSVLFFRNLLKETNDIYLLEFNRRAKSQCDENYQPFWNGFIENGVLFGENQMGKYLMKIREYINDDNEIFIQHKKQKIKSELSETITKIRTGKKMYKMGQKKDKPDDMEGVFIFYDTLYKEDPNSDMAEIWLLEHGCFDNKSQKILAKKYGRDKITKIKSKKKNTKRTLDNYDNKHKKKKRKLSNNDNKKLKKDKKDKKSKKNKLRKRKGKFEEISEEDYSNEIVGNDDQD